jgi:hypothetical protein
LQRHISKFLLIIIMITYIVTYPGFAWLMRRFLDLMIEFIGPLYNWLLQFTNHYLTHCQLLPTGHSTGTILTSNWTPLYSFVLRYTASIQSQSHIATDGQSVSLGVEHHLWLMIRYLLLFWQLRSCFLWDALSDEKTGLSFVYAAAPCERSLSLVRVPWDSRPYYTVSDLRFPFSSPPTTRRVTMEVFDPASTRVWSKLWVWVLCYDRRSVGQSVLV